MQNRLASETECEICMDTFTTQGLSEPRVCPCGHTFCMKCLLALQKSQCPNCRVPIKGNVNSLPKNYSLISLLSNSSSADRKREDRYELLHEKMRIEKALASLHVDEEEDENKNSILLSISKLEEERTIETESLAVMYQNIERIKLEAELKRLGIENMNSQIRQQQKALSEIGISGRKAMVESYVSERDAIRSSNEIVVVSAEANTKNLLDEIKSFTFSNQLQTIQPAASILGANAAHARVSGQRPLPPPPPLQRQSRLQSSSNEAVTTVAVYNAASFPTNQQVSVIQSSSRRAPVSSNSRGSLLEQIRSRAEERISIIRSIPA